MKQLVIVAAGGLGREAASVVERSAEFDLIGFLDDAPALTGTTVAGAPVLGGLAAVREFPDASLLVAAGKGQGRRAIVGRLRDLGVTADRYATLIAPDVHIPASCTVGHGSILLSGTVLTADVTVGAHVVTMPGVVLTHDDQLCDFATLCAQVALGGNVAVGQAAYLGMGALAREGITLGDESVLGMGSVLLTDLPEGETWVGTPARNILHSSTIQEKAS